MAAQDERDLKRWLQNRSRQDCVQLAHRAAMRVGPVNSAGITGRNADSDLKELPVLRGCLISGAAATWPACEFNAAAAADALRDAAKTYRAGKAAVPAFDAAAASKPIVESETNGAVHHTDGGKTLTDRCVAHAVDAADDAERYCPAAWQATWNDVRQLKRGIALDAQPLWPGGDNPLSEQWERTRTAWEARGPGWRFWIDWYEDALAGRPPNREMLKEIALIDAEDWDNGSDHVNALIADIRARYQQPDATPLAKAAVTDFTFDSMLQQMKAVGFEEDAAHLRDPARVQAFLDDMEEARDGLSDFSDYASDARGKSNSPALLQLAADKMLEELRRTKSTEQLRARRIVTLGKHLESFINEEARRDELGTTLAELLDENVSLISDVCRKHFMPSIQVLSVLDHLELEEGQSTELIDRLEAAIGRIDRADGKDLVPLRQEDVLMLREMLDELKSVETSIGEARTESHANRQRGILARGGGALGATIGKYTEMSVQHTESAGKRFDQGVRWYRRWQKMSDMLDWLEWFGSGGAPPT